MFSSSPRMALRSTLLWFANWFATDFYDLDSGRKLGRALVISWRGKVHIIGLHANSCKVVVVPQFIPSPTLSYWRQELGFVATPPVDFKREASGPDTPR